MTSQWSLLPLVAFTYVHTCVLFVRLNIADDCRINLNIFLLYFYTFLVNIDGFYRHNVVIRIWILLGRME